MAITWEMAAGGLRQDVCVLYYRIQNTATVPGLKSTLLSPSCLLRVETVVDTIQCHANKKRAAQPPFPSSMMQELLPSANDDVRV